MNTEELYEDRAHGLLATAFDGDVPTVNLVPGAVAGYRRHRRRTRVLGAAGGALALAGIVAAGTALAGTATGGGKSVSADAGGGGRTGAGVAARGTSPDCQGVFYRFGDLKGDSVFTGDDATLKRVCESDLSHLGAAIPGARVLPARESFAQALARHDVPPGTPLPSGVTKDTPLIAPGSYVVKANGQTADVTLMVAHKQRWGFYGCWAPNCPPNLALADGTPATENPGSAQAYIASLSAHPDSVHWVWFMATPESEPKATLGFDFGKAIRTEAFAEAVAYDIQNLNVLD